MSEQSGTGHNVSIPVDDLGPLARHLDATADDIDASLRRVRADTDDVQLNDADEGLSRSQFTSRLLAVTDRARRTTAQLRATAALTADTAERATEADQAGTDRSEADRAAPAIGGVVDRLANNRPSTGERTSPDWQQVWTQAAAEQDVD